MCCIPIHAIVLSGMSENYGIHPRASQVKWRTPQTARSLTATILHWRFICGAVVACITWSQTLLVFTIKPLFSSAPPGQQRWTLLGITVKQGGSIKSTVVWLLDLESVLKYTFKEFFSPPEAIIFPPPRGEFPFMLALTQTTCISPEADLFPIAESEPSHLYSS